MYGKCLKIWVPQNTFFQLKKTRLGAPRFLRDTHTFLYYVYIYVCVLSTFEFTFTCIEVI